MREERMIKSAKASMITALTVEPPIRDHPWCLRLRWSLTGGGYLTGSFTNSNLTEGGSNWDFGCWSLTRGGHSAREVPVYYSVHKNKQIIKNRAKFKIVSGSTFREWIAVALKIDKFVRFVWQEVLSTRTCHPPYKTLKHCIFHYSKWWYFMVLWSIPWYLLYVNSR